MHRDILSAPGNKPKDTLTDDLEFMYKLPVEDRYSFIRTIMGSEELWKLDVLDEKDLDWLESYYIKDFKDERGIGFSETKKPLVHTLEKQAFLKLDQCRIVELDTTGHKQYTKVNLSECSLLVARNERHLWMAHIGMSEHTQMKHALEQLQSTGLSAQDIQVVASVGPTQEAANVSRYSKRLASSGDYEAYGVDPANIIPFNFVGQTETDSHACQLCEVIVGPEGMLVTTFDALIYSQHGLLQEKIVEETVEERFIASLTH